MGVCPSEGSTVIGWIWKGEAMTMDEMAMDQLEVLLFRSTLEITMTMTQSLI